MEKIVYILGAGFSQPLGLPVMSNFIDMARDLYSKDAKKYAYFNDIFKIIRKELAWINTIYDTDLNNIEEVLSILEMLRTLDPTKESEVSEYKQFIVDVINYYTPSFNIYPELEPIEKGLFSLTSTSWMSLLGDNDHQNARRQLFEILLVGYLQKLYSAFVLGLFTKRIITRKQSQTWSIVLEPISNPYAEYSVITLNYDMVLERTALFLSSISTGTPLKFLRPSDEHQEGCPIIVKLHGSVDDQNIIPPTWNKSVHSIVEKDWQAAYSLLGSANHIRIIGYSLPTTDAYVRYLLKASIINNENLKSINVMCLDKYGTIKSKYDEFIKLPTEKYQFQGINTEHYLNSVTERVIENGWQMDNFPNVRG